MRSLTVTENDSGQRLDKFVLKTTRGMPASLLYKYIRTKRIKVNGRRANPSLVLAPGDVVELYISDEFFGAEAGAFELSSIKPHLSVVYEDENIIICDKPEGVLVHSGDIGGEASSDSNTLIGHIKAYLYQKGEYDPVKENSFAPALCNRIDRNTRGLVISAKNAAALREMNRLIRDGFLSKYYLTVVHGIPTPREGTLKGFLRKDAKANTVKIFDHPVPGGRTAITKYRVLKTTVSETGPLSLLEVELVTGRTHQIRAHMASAGWPLLGEGKYGKNAADRAAGYKNQALMAYKIVFSHNIDEASPLSYLRGRVISLSPTKAPFMREFR